MYIESDDAYPSFRAGHEPDEQQRALPPLRQEPLRHLLQGEE